MDVPFVNIFSFNFIMHKATNTQLIEVSVYFAARTHSPGGTVITISMLISKRTAHNGLTPERDSEIGRWVMA